MIIKEKIGNLSEVEQNNRTIDWLPMQWYETGKRILHIKTASGREVMLRFLNQHSGLFQNDVVYQDEQSLIVVDIQPCNVITLYPKNLYETALVCYEIGNKHLPLFFEDDTLLMPFDAPFFRLLKAAGFNPVQETRKLLHPLKTSVAPHAHSDRESLFSKILKRTTTPDAF